MSFLDDLIRKGQNLACDAFGIAGGSVYENIAVGWMRNHNPDGNKVHLDSKQKDALKSTFENLVDNVWILYDATLIDKFEISDWEIGASSNAQTYGRRIYLKSPKVDYSDTSDWQKQVILIAHEMVHVQQFEKAGSRRKFGEMYFEEYCKEGFKYRENYYEEEAYHIENCFKKRLTGGVTIPKAWTGTHSRSWTHFAQFNKNDDQYYLKYKTNTGKVKIDKILYDKSNKTITGVTGVWEGNWSKKWSEIKPFMIDSNCYIIKYKESTGRVKIDKIIFNNLNQPIDVKEEWDKAANGCWSKD